MRIVSTRTRFLQSGIFLILLFSASTYAIPLFQVDLAHSLSGEAHHVRYIDFTKTRSEAGDGSVRISPFSLNRHGSVSAMLMDNFNSSRFNVFYGFRSASGNELPGSDLTGFLILDYPSVDFLDLTHIIGSDDDKNAVDGFFATLGISTADLQTAGGYPSAFMHEASPAAAPAIIRRSPRDGCLQQRQTSPPNQGLRVSFCAEEAGPARSGGSNSAGGTGRTRISGGGVGNSAGAGSPNRLVDNRSDAGSGSGSGGGGGGGGLGVGNSAPGGTGTTSSGSDHPGTYNGGEGEIDSALDLDNAGGGTGTGGGSGIGSDGGVGDSGNGNWSDDGILPGEIGTIPEPGTLALLVLGLAGMFVARRSGWKSIE